MASSRLLLDTRLSLNEDSVYNYCRFTSALMQRQLAERIFEGESLDTYSETVFASLCLADISGFTRLSATLNAEQLKVHINEYFTRLLGVVRQNHGDVIKFLGDAVLILWPVDKDADDEVQAAATMMACVCALQLLEDCGNYDRQVGQHKVELRLHCGVVCGHVHCMCVGEGDRWEYLISGDKLKELGETESEAKTGEVCVSETAYAMVEEHLEAVKMTKSYKLDGYFKPNSSLSKEYKTFIAKNRHICQSQSDNSLATRTTSGTSDGSDSPAKRPGNRVSINKNSIAGILKGKRSSTERLLSLPPMSLSERTNKKVSSPRILDGADSMAVQDTIKSKFQIIRELLPKQPYDIVREYLSEFLLLKDEHEISEDCSVLRNPSFKPILNTFVHHAARQAIQNNNIEYLPELRNVVTIFIEVLAMENDLALGAVNRPQKALSIVLRSLRKFEGSLRQYVVDDKGCVMIAAFGLPDSSHEDNCTRAVEVAIDIGPKFDKIGIKCRIGIAEGSVYCGIVGCITDRCEYAMMGCSVNLAARLMGKSESGVIVSETVHDMASRHFVFQELDPVNAKGYDKPVRIFKPESRAITKSLFDSEKVHQSFVGRDDELETLLSAFKKSLEDRKWRQPVNGTKDDARSGSVSCQRVAQAFIVEGGVGVGKKRLVTEVLRRSAEESIIVNALVATGNESHQSTPYFIVRQLLETIFGLKIGQKLVSKRRASTVASMASSIPTFNSPHQRPNVPRQKSNFNFLRGMKSTRHMKNEDNAEQLKLYDDDNDYLSCISDVVKSWEDSSGTETRLDEDSLPHFNERALRVPENALNVEDLFSKSFSISKAHSGVPSLTSLQSQSSVLSCQASKCSQRLSSEMTPISPLSSSVSSSTRSALTRKFSVLFKPALEDIIETANKASSPIEADHNYRLEALIPLLAEPLQCHFLDSTVTRALSDSERVRLRDSLIVKVLLMSLESRYNLILVDKLQLADSESLRILLRVIRGMTRGIFLATRRIKDSKPSYASSRIIGGTYQESMSLTSVLSKMCQVISLGPLGVDDTRSMVLQIVSKKLLDRHPQVLSDVAIKQIHSRSSGSPVHTIALIKELKRALVMNEFTSIDDLPALAQSQVVLRFDLLDDNAKVVLKTASVIGFRFFENEVRHVLETQGNDGCVRILTSALQTLVDNNLIAIDDTVDEEEQGYIFTDRTIQESIIMLMIGETKENVHIIIAQYLEKSSTAVTHRSSDITRHYIHSNDIKMKVIHLERAAKTAARECSIVEVYRYYKQLVDLVIGIEVNLVLEKSFKPSAHDEVTLRTIQQVEEYKRISNPKFSMRSTSSDAMSDAGTHAEVTKKGPWIFRNNWHRRIKTLAAHGSPLLGSVAGLYIDQSSLCTWLGHMGEVQYRLGNLSACQSLINLAFYNKGIKVPHVGSLDYLRSKCRYSRQCFGIFKPKAPVVESEEEYIMYLSMFEQQVVLFLLHGYAIPARMTLEMVYDMIMKYKENEVYLSEERNQKRRGSSASEFRLKNIYRQFDALDAIVRGPCRGFKKQKKSGTTYETPSWMEDSIDMFEIVGSEHGSERSNRNLLVSMCRSIMASNQGDFTSACDVLSECVNSIGKLSPINKHMHFVCMVMHGWVSALSGDLQAAQNAVNSTYQYVWSHSHVSCLLQWVHELDVFILTLAEKYTAAEATWMRLRGRLPRDVFGPTTAALIAFSMTRNNKARESLARVYAVYACKKLSTRSFCNVTAGILLFCAVYAALDVVEATLNAEELSVLGVEPRKADSGTRYMEVYKLCGYGGLKTELTKAADMAAKALERMSEYCPCLTLLHLCISARWYRLFKYVDEPYPIVDILYYIDSKLHAVQTRRNLESFKFGNAYFHLQRSLLCEYLNLPRTFMIMKTADSKLMAEDILDMYAGLDTQSLKFEFSSRDISDVNDDIDLSTDDPFFE